MGSKSPTDVQLLVLELVPGETLAERLAPVPLRMEEALQICRQIAEALEAAHEKGIIHRDLKPANVKITPEGKVKVLDFGLAKASAAMIRQAIFRICHRQHRRRREKGIILGTAAYMSPEQARGQAVDKRTDIWAFGCVLYEMLTGPARVSRRDGLGHGCGDPGPRAGLARAAGSDTGEDSVAAAPLSRERSRRAGSTTSPTHGSSSTKR